MDGTVTALPNELALVARATAEPATWAGAERSCPVYPSPGRAMTINRLRKLP